MTEVIKRRSFKLGDTGIRVLAFLIIIGVFAAINPVVLSLVNVFSIANTASFLGIMSIAVMVVMITGNIDVSVTSIGLISAYSAIMVFLHFGIEEGGMVLMFVISGAVGIICGLINAFFVYKFNIPGIIVSLGTSQIYSSILVVIFGLTHINILPADMRMLSRTILFRVETDLGHASIGVSVLIFIVSIVSVWFVLNKTMIGRGIYALGGDKVATARVGFNVPLVYSAAYALMGFWAGIGGMIFYANATFFAGDYIQTELNNILGGVILGGVILQGGKGTVGGVVVGVLLLGLIRNNLYLIGIPAFAQRVTIGILLLVSVVFTYMKRK